jgi:hypothetical protein
MTTTSNDKESEGSDCREASIGVQDRYNYSERPQHSSRRHQRSAYLFILIRLEKRSEHLDLPVSINVSSTTSSHTPPASPSPPPFVAPENQDHTFEEEKEEEKEEGKEGGRERKGNEYLDSSLFLPHYPSFRTTAQRHKHLPTTPSDIKWHTTASDHSRLSNKDVKKRKKK